MKKIFVIYKENGTLKKGELSEERFRILQSSTSITEVQTYSNKKLMETTYGTLLCPNNNCNKKLLID